MQNLFNPYQPNYQQPYYQAPAQQQIQNGGFVSVRNEIEARNYPIAPGNSITFKDETSPYVYTKTMGFSQLDRPVFEKYKLIKEEDEIVEQSITPKESYALQADLNNLIDEVASIRDELNIMKSKRPSTKRKEVFDDE